MGARYDDFGKAADAAYNQRVMAVNGLGPTKQELINQRLAGQRYDQERVREQGIKNDAAEFALNEAQYPRYQPTASMSAGTRTKAPTAGTQIPTQQSAGYQYNIDNQAAQDAGNFLKALKGETGSATNRKTGAPDTTTALELLNKTPYSSINNATGISLNTDEQGNQMVNIMGPENAVLKQIPMATLERQLSNLNDYASRGRMVTTPGREAILESKELAEGAAAARAVATDPQNLMSMGYTLDESGRYARQGKAGGLEFYDANTAGEQAYTDYMQQYGPRAETQQWQVDPGFARTQTQPTQGSYDLGFSTASRQPRQPAPGQGMPDPAALAAQLAGAGGGNDQGGAELPPPDQASAQRYQPAPTNKPIGGSRYIPSPFVYQPSGTMGEQPQTATQQAKYQPAPVGTAPQQTTAPQQPVQQPVQLTPQELGFISQVERYQSSGKQISQHTLDQIAQLTGLSQASYQKVIQHLQGAA